MEKKQRFKKILGSAGRIAKGIVKGVLDVALPNMKGTITMKESDLDDEKPKFDIDFPRLITAITVWILLILVFFGKIKFADVVGLLEKLFMLK
jgi:hypothetical protein